MTNDQLKKFNVEIVTFANTAVLDESWKEIKVGSLWQDRPVVFIFLRHFGCPSCRAHAEQVWRGREKFEKTGAKIVFVGNGQPNFISGFKQDLGINEAVIYTDPSLKAFRACGFNRGFLASIGPNSMLNGMKLIAKGYKANISSGGGDWWQLGGIVAVQKSGTVTYHYISKSLGDFPTEIEQQIT